MSAPAEKTEIPTTTTTTTQPEQKKTETAPAATHAATPANEAKTEKKEETKKTGVAKYRKFVYYFFASTAGLLVSYFAYRRFQKRH